MLVSRLKTECERAGISLSELARRAGIQKLTAMKAAKPFHEVGSLGVDVMERMAAALNRPVGEIFYYANKSEATS